MWSSRNKNWPIGLDLGSRCIKMLQLIPARSGGLKVAAEMRVLPVDLPDHGPPRIDAITALIQQMTQRLDMLPHCYVTGGEASRVFSHLAGPDGPARLVPNMVLAGIRITAEELS